MTVHFSLKRFWNLFIFRLEYYRLSAIRISVEIIQLWEPGREVKVFEKMINNLQLIRCENPAVAWFKIRMQYSTWHLIQVNYHTFFTFTLLTLSDFTSQAQFHSRPELRSWELRSLLKGPTVTACPGNLNCWAITSCSQRNRLQTSFSVSTLAQHKSLQEVPHYFSN